MRALTATSLAIARFSGRQPAIFIALGLYRGLWRFASIPDLQRMVGTNWVGPGGHVITYPIFKAIAADRPIGVIHIDVHPDTWGGAQRLLYGLRGLNLVGGDVVEGVPPYDQTGNTTLVGASMMFEILCLVADSNFGVGKTTRRPRHVFNHRHFGRRDGCS